jgi:hypothetical protein
MVTSNSTSRDAQTRDELRVNTFGLLGDHNHISLRAKFPELSIEEALFCLEMVMDNPRDPHITEDQMAEVIRTTASLRLSDMVGIDDAAWYLERADNDAYKAYQHAKEGGEVKNKLQQMEATSKANFIESFMSVTGVDFERAAHAGQNSKYQNVEAAINGYYEDCSVHDLAASNADPSSEEKNIWAEKFIDSTDAFHFQAHHYGRKYCYSDELLETAVASYLNRKTGDGLYNEDEEDDNNGQPGHYRHYGPIGYAFPHNPFHDLDAAIDGSDFSLLSRWTETPVSQQIRQLDLAQNLNTFEAFRWIAATSRMTNRHEKYIQESWNMYSKEGTRETAHITGRHIRRHNVDAYQDVAKAGGMECDRKLAKRHLRWSEDFGVAMRCGFIVETLTKKQEDGIRKLDGMRTTWRLRLTRLNRLRDLILRPGYGYTRLRQSIEPGWGGLVALDVDGGFACAGPGIDGAKDVVEDATALNIDRQFTERTIQGSYKLGSRTGSGSSSSEGSSETGEESGDDVWEDVMEIATDEVVEHAADIEKERVEKKEEKLIDFD